MKMTTSPELLALVFASSLLLGICVQAAEGREANDEATFTVIDVPGARYTGAFGINSAGKIAGFYGDPVESGGMTHGFLLDKDGFTSIDFPGAIFTSAAAINNRGDIVGRQRSADGMSHGYLLSRGEFLSFDFPEAI